MCSTRVLGAALSALACAPVRPAPTLALVEASALAPIEVIVSRSPEPEPRLTESGTRHRLELGRRALEVDAADGGRIVEFSLDGKNLVQTREASPVAYGSSFWPSPQSDWNWPPPPELDRLPWRAKNDGTAIVLESATNAALGLAGRQRLLFDAESGALSVGYTLENRGTNPRRVAPWENTRVRPHGLTFYPSHGPALPNSTLALPLVEGIAWLQHDPETMKENAKSFADGAEGWLAHVDRDLLLLKVFPDVPRGEQAPGEAEIELYVDKTGLFVEVEQQGPYAEIAPGGSASWTVYWLSERLPKGLAVSAGNPLLVSAARALARTVPRDPKFGPR